MESVFNQQYSFETDIIDTQKYFEEYAKLLKPFEKCQEENCRNGNDLDCGTDDCKDDDFYMSFLEITKEELKELRVRTSFNHLTCDGEIEPVVHEFHKKFDGVIKQRSKSTENKPETSLASIKNEEKDEAGKTEFPRKFFKYCNYQWGVPVEKLVNNGLDFDCSELSSVVFCVKVYHPFLSTCSKPVKVKLLQEILILGNQRLSQLKDKIVCSVDYTGDKDESNEYFLKDVGHSVTAKDEYPSSFIFIDKTFYNDTRSTDLVDLSKEIREWASKRNIGPFECSSMENTKMCDLKLKIGRPYVYLHQGNCEHLIVISDIRFINLTDPGKSTLYPRVQCTGRTYGKHCMMCSDAYARWLVVGNERLTHEKTYLCRKCFLSYNYVNGQKVGQFRAYKYVDTVALL